MANFSISSTLANNPWYLNHTFTEPSSKLLISTKDQYMDRDIDIDFNIQSAEVSLVTSPGEVTLDPSYAYGAGSVDGRLVSIVPQTSSPSTGHYISLRLQKQSATVTGTLNVTRNGWIAADDMANQSSATVVNIAAKTLFFPLPTATPQFEGGTITLTNGAEATTAMGTNLDFEATDTDPGTGVSFYTYGEAGLSRANITYKDAVAGWLKVAAGDTAYATATSKLTLPHHNFYATGVTLDKGKWFDFTNAINETVKIKYNSDTNAIDFIFD